MKPFKFLNIRTIQQAGLKTSTLALIAGNAVPLIGVMFLGWSLFTVIVLFWFENVIIGFYNVLKMLFAAGTMVPEAAKNETGNPAGESASPYVASYKHEEGISLPASGLTTQLSKLFFIPFFTFHYGMFTLVHGIFVFVLFGPDSPFRSHGISPLNAGPMFSLVGQHLYVPALVLFISHGVSFISNYLMKGEWREESPATLMGKPYGRIVVLHLTIIGGGFFLQAAGATNVLVLSLFVVLKTMVDLSSHVKEHAGQAITKKD